MTVFSVHLVVLACLCAALPLARPVEGAHLHVSRSMEKHTTSPHPPHGTHTPSSFDGSTPAHKHKHNDEHNDHREHEHKHERRLTRPPPLLRHYREHDHNAVHHPSQDAHDRAGDKIPRSAFARSRYRRERTSRSSVYVPGEHGSTYIVSGTSRRRGEPGQASADKQTNQRRQAPGNNPASGRIDIMSAAQSPSSTQRLASLAVDSTPIDWTSGQTSTKAFQLNASTTNRTQFVMVPTNDSDTAGKYVRLATPVFDAGSADTVMYCATYNANPGTPSALLMTPCADGLASSNDDAIGPCADDKDDASSSDSKQSQIFSYDPFSGVIEPILSTEGPSSGNSSSDISASCAGAKVRRDASNSTTSSSATPSSTSTNTAPTPNVSQRAQNVTLVYVAGALEVPAPSPSASASSTTGSTTATPSAHMRQDAVVTTTVTTTVVTTVMASGTVSPAMADASVPTSSPATSTPRPSVSSSSTTSSGTAMTTPDAEESLEVEVVGLAPSTSTPAPTITTSSTSTSTTSSSSSRSTASTSLNAEAVASLVVKQMHHRSVVAIASASVV